MGCFLMKRLAVLAAIMVLSSQVCVFGLGAGTSNADFLKIGAGSRPSAMGEAFTAVADDSNGAFWNPAGITAVDKISATYMYLLWYQSETYHYFSYVMPIDSGTNFGISANALITPGFDSTGGLMPAVPSSYDLAVTGTIAKNLGNIYTKDFTIGNISLGANLKFIKRSLVGVDLGTFFFADIGAIANITDDMKLGLVMQDIGSALGADPSPFTTRLGLSYNLAFTKETGLLLAADVIKPIDLTNPDFQKWEFGLGAEVKLFGVGFIRGGYKLGQDDQGPTAGGGISWGWGSLDYAFLPHAELGYTHRISASFKFGNTVARPLVGAPQQPQHTTAIAGDRIVSVGWDPNPEGNITGYNIYYREKGKGKYVKLNTEPIMEEAKFKAVLNNDVTYSFVVTAINNRDLESVYSAPVEATPKKNIVVKPPKVEGVSVKLQDKALVVTWNGNNSENIAGFNMYYKKEGDAKFKKLNRSVLRETKATLGGLTAGVKYYFTVTAVSIDGLEGDFSTVVSDTVPDTDYY